MVGAVAAKTADGKRRPWDTRVSLPWRAGIELPILPDRNEKFREHVVSRPSVQTFSPIAGVRDTRSCAPWCVHSLVVVRKVARPALSRRLTKSSDGRVGGLIVRGPSLRDAGRACKLWTSRKAVFKVHVPRRTLTDGPRLAVLLNAPIVPS